VSAKSKLPKPPAFSFVSVGDQAFVTLPATLCVAVSSDRPVTLLAAFQ
jgi:hypothetical protein